MEMLKEMGRAILPMLITMVKLIAGQYPVGIALIGMIDAIIAGTKDQDGISDKSVKDILVAVAKSKSNSIDQTKVLKALKALGLDTITKEEMEGVPEAPKKTNKVVPEAEAEVTAVKK